MATVSKKIILVPTRCYFGHGVAFWHNLQNPNVFERAGLYRADKVDSALAAIRLIRGDDFEVVAR